MFFLRFIEHFNPIEYNVELTSINKWEVIVGNSITTLRELIKTGALGINPDTPVTLSYEYSEDVAHYTDDN